MQDELDFEISFFEKLIKEKPDFVDALIPLGDAYTKRGLHKEGLEVDKRLAKLRPDDPVVWYNLACSYSLIKDVNSSLEALERAIGLGYRDFAFMGSDPDLKNARADKRYKGLLAKVDKKV